MYGFRPRGSFYTFSSQISAKRAAAETMQRYDPVNIVAGAVNVLDATDEDMAGILITATAVVTDLVQYDNTPGLTFIADNDNDSTTFAAAHEYTNFDMIGGTGAVQIDTSSTSESTAQVKCLKYNPKGVGLDSDTSIGLFIVNEIDVLKG